MFISFKFRFVKWLGTISESLSNQKFDIDVRAMPFPGMGLFSITSNADILSEVTINKCYKKLEDNLDYEYLDTK